MAAFIRYFEGGERRFGKIVTGAAYPESACPRGPSAPCDALVRTSTIAPRRRTVIEPGWHQADASERARRGDPGQRPLIGVLRSDSDECGRPAVGPPLIPCPGPTPELEGLLELLGGQAVVPQDPVGPLWVNRSFTPQLVATWGGRSTLGTRIPRRFDDVHRFRDLVLRSVTTLAPRNPAAAGNEAGTATQRYDIVLVDRHGDQDRLPAKRFSAALEPALGDTMRQLILSDVRIPLRRFEGVDLRNLRAVRLRLGVRGRHWGQVQVADLAFQGRVGGSGSAGAAGRVVRGRPGTAVDAIPLDAVTDPAGVAGCGDSTSPRASMSRTRRPWTEAGCQPTEVPPTRGAAGWRACSWRSPIGSRTAAGSSARTGSSARSPTARIRTR